MNLRRLLSSCGFVAMSILGASCAEHQSADNSATPAPQTAGPDKPAFSCGRHIYNDSDCRWTFWVPEAGQDGNVYFSGFTCTQEGKRVAVPGDCSSTPNGPCTIPPHCSVSIQYTYTGGYTGGYWHVKDQNGNEKSWGYDTRARIEECPYIHHSGSTGGVYLNEPADGDMTAGGCTL
jgi:hypothetical protein